MPYYAQVNNGRVVAVTQTSAHVNALNMVAIASFDDAGPGWLYDGSAFSPPPPITYFSLTAKSFWRRFTAAEREALQGIIATGTQTQKNKLNAFRDYIATGGNVELNDDYIRAGVTLMETAGIIGAGRALAILDAPVQDAERM